METATNSLAGLVSWGGRNGRQLILSDAATEKVARKTLSPSTAAAMRGCPSKWVIDRLLPRTSDPFGAPDLGTAAHAVFESLFRLPAEERTVNRGLELSQELHISGKEEGISIPSDPGDLHRWHEEVLHRVVGLWGIEDPRGVEVVDVEVDISDVEIAGIPFHGFVDRVSLVNGEIEVVDYKTGLSKPKKPGRYGDDYGDQVRLYVQGLNEMGKFGTATRGSLFYTAHRYRRDVECDDKSMKSTIDGFKQSHEVLTKQVEKQAFTTKPTALCGWCPAVSVCPAAIANGKSERVAFDLSGADLHIGGSPTPTKASDTQPPSGDPVLPESEPAPTQSSTKDNRKEQTMYESKPYEEVLGDGSLNLNSYAATAAFGIAELAVDTLHYAGQPIKGSSVTALAHTFATIISDVETELGANPCLQSGINSRLRGALRSSLRTSPVPLGADANTWAEWVAKTEQRMKSIYKVALSVWEMESGSDESPWLTLAAAPDLKAVGS
jgi:putative RecB family exonuclease